jgi:hypothetical protein
MHDPVNIQNLEWSEWSHQRKFGGKSKRISDAAGGQRIGVVLEDLPPGRRSSPVFSSSFSLVGRRARLDIARASHTKNRRRAAPCTGRRLLFFSPGR